MSMLSRQATMKPNIMPSSCPSDGIGVYCGNSTSLSPAIVSVFYSGLAFLSSFQFLSSPVRPPMNWFVIVPFDGIP